MRRLRQHRSECTFSQTRVARSARSADGSLPEPPRGNAWEARGVPICTRASIGRSVGCTGEVAEAAWRAGGACNLTASPISLAERQAPRLETALHTRRRSECAHLWG